MCSQINEMPQDIPSSGLLLNIEFTYALLMDI